MGLFEILFGKKGNSTQVNRGTIKKKNIDKTLPTIKLYNQVVDAIVFSEKLKDSLKNQIKSALDNPKSFYNDKNEYTLSDRFLTFPMEAHLTPKFVLVDILIENDQMVEVDWKESETEIRNSVMKIMTTKHHNFEISTKCLYNKNTDSQKILQLINDKELKPNGYCLSIVDINSDSYVFTIVPIKISSIVADLFEELSNM